MLKKEFRDTLRILLESSMLMLSIPFIMLISFIFGLDSPGGDLSTKSDLVRAVALLTAFAFAGYSGMAFFLSERRDKGFEYLLTLPISRWKIFLYKLAPRLLVLLLIFVLFALLGGATVKGILYPLLTVQIGMIFLSLAFSSYFAGFIAFVLLGFFYSLGIKFVWYALYVLDGNSYGLFGTVPVELIALLLPGIPLAISFFKVFLNYDLKPARFTLKPYYYIALPVILVEFIVIFVFYQGYYYI